MNRRIISQSLVLDRNYVEPVIKAVLHTVLFHRYFGNVVPKENDIFSGVTYVSVDDPEIADVVNTKVAELMHTLSTTSDSKSQISLYFTETKPRKAWFSKSDEEICWEEWTFNVQTRTGTSGEQQESEAKNQAKKAIFRVIQEMDTHKDHIPLIASSQTNPFPYHITVAPASGLWSSMIKRAILPGMSS